MNRPFFRNPGFDAWLRWLGNWGLALADLGYLPAERGDIVVVDAEQGR